MMSADYDQHIILHHLDDPLRLLYWTTDEAMIILIPIFGGLFSGYALYGLLSAGIGYWGLRKVKKKYGLESLKHVLYWNLPKSSKKLPNTPPSYIREYIG